MHCKKKNNKNKVIAGVMICVVMCGLVGLAAGYADPKGGFSTSYTQSTTSKSYTANNYSYVVKEPSPVVVNQKPVEPVKIVNTITSNNNVSNSSSNSQRSVTPARIENYSGSAHTNTNEMTYLGNYYVTGYDICVQCCGKTDGITASGARATVGRTCAHPSLPFGTVLYIEGIGIRVVEDRGGSLDVLCSSHDECFAITGNRNVYLVR